MLLQSTDGDIAFDLITRGIEGSDIFLVLQMIEVDCIAEVGAVCGITHTAAHGARRESK